jgi:small subunit ribosomal protein S15e
MADALEGLSPEEIARIAESRKKRSFKKFTFRGIDLDKLLDLKPEELLPLFTSRIRRRLQRPIKRKHKALVKKLKNAKKNTGPLEKPAIIKTHLRDLIITPELIGSIVAIYNGKLFNPVEIKPEMVGMYTGEFSMSYRYVAWWRVVAGVMAVVVGQKGEEDYVFAYTKINDSHLFPSYFSYTTHRPVKHGRPGIGSTNSSRFIPLH